MKIYHPDHLKPLRP